MRLNNFGPGRLNGSPLIPHAYKAVTTQGRLMMKATLTRIAILATATLVVAACSSGSSNNRSSETVDTGGGGGGTPTTTATVSGTAAAGLIIGGTVSVFPIVSGTVSSTASGTGTTDSAGVYSVEIDDHEGAVKVVITASSSTTMICDAPDGCGTTAFGGSTPLTTDFSLSAMVPSVADAVTATAHITPLTHMAAVFAEEQSSITATVIQEAQSQLQSALGISFDILETAPIDITTTSNLTSISEDQLNYSLFTAAIAGLAESEGSGGATFAANLDTILTSLAADFAANSGQLFQSAASTGSGSDQVTLAEILRESQSVITAIEDKAVTDSVTLSTAVTMLLDETEETLDDSQTIAELNQGESTTGQSDPDPDATDLEKAKGMVADFRTVADILGDDDGDLDDTLDDHFAAIDSFARGTNLSNMNRVLVSVVNAQLSGVSIPTSASFNGVTYSIDMTGGSIPSEESTSQVITLPTGTITGNNGSVLTVSTGSMLTATYASATQLSSESDLDSATGIAFTLMATVTITAADSADLNTFTGGLMIAASNQSSCNESAISAYDFTGTFSSSAEANSNTFKVGLEANISNASCSTIDLDTDGVIDGDTNLVFQSGLTGSEFILTIRSDVVAGEATNSSIKIIVGSVIMDIEESTDQDGTDWLFENQDQVTLTLLLTDGEVTSGSPIGSISVGGTDYASVTRSDSTGYTATFTDNTTLSFP